MSYMLFVEENNSYPRCIVVEGLIAVFEFLKIEEYNKHDSNIWCYYIGDPDDINQKAEFEFSLENGEFNDNLQVVFERILD